MPTLLAQAVFAGNVGHLLIVALVVAGVIGIALVVARQAGITVPPWLVQVLWIVLAVVVGVVAIRFLMGLL